MGLARVASAKTREFLKKKKISSFLLVDHFQLMITSDVVLPHIRSFRR